MTPLSMQPNTFIEMIDNLLLIESASAALLGGDKKKIRKFNKEWLYSKDMIELKALYNKASANDSSLTGSDVSQGIYLTERLAKSGEALILRLVG